MEKYNNYLHPFPKGIGLRAAEDAHPYFAADELKWLASAQALQRHAALASNPEGIPDPSPGFAEPWDLIGERATPTGLCQRSGQPIYGTSSRFERQCRNPGFSEPRAGIRNAVGVFSVE
jgi:hypothetical protein